MSAVAGCVSLASRKLVGRYVDEIYLDAPSSFVGKATIFVSNHVAYWDGVVARLASAHLGKELRLQVSAGVIRDFPFLRSLGVAGVDETDPVSVAKALAADRAFIGGSDVNALWLFAQGRYRPQEAASEHFRRGVAHLVRKLPVAAVVPVALRYDIMRTRKPVVYVDIGNDVSENLQGLGPGCILGTLQTLHADLVATQRQQLTTGTTRYVPLVRNGRGSYAVGRFYYCADVRRQLRAFPGATRVDVRAKDPGFAIEMRGHGGTATAALDFLIDRYSLDEASRHVVENDFAITWRNT